MLDPSGAVRDGLRAIKMEDGLPLREPLGALGKSDVAAIQVIGHAGDVVVEGKGKASTEDKIRDGAFEEMVRTIDEFGIVDEIEIDPGAELSVGVAPGDLAAATATEIPAIIGAGAIAHPAVVDLVSDFLWIAGKGLRFSGVEALRPGIDEALGRVIEVLDDYGTGAAFVAELGHRLGDKEAGGQAVFGKDERCGGGDAIDEAGDFEISLRPHLPDDFEGEHD